MHNAVCRFRQLPPSIRCPPRHTNNRKPSWHWSYSIFVHCTALGTGLCGDWRRTGTTHICRHPPCYPSSTGNSTHNSSQHDGCCCWGWVISYLGAARVHYPAPAWPGAVSVYFSTYRTDHRNKYNSHQISSSVFGSDVNLFCVALLPNSTKLGLLSPPKLSSCAPSKFSSLVPHQALVPTCNLFNPYCLSFPPRDPHNLSSPSSHLISDPPKL